MTLALLEYPPVPPRIARLVTNVAAEERLIEAWNAGRVPAVAATFGCSVYDAALLVFFEGLLPRRTLLTLERLQFLLEHPNLGSPRLAEKLGVSRWTIRDWRTQLGLIAA
jgi:hypothetical protein